MISIGLPAVKPQFLAEAIKSVLRQSYEDFELIVLNDRLDANIREIVKSHEDPRIIYIEEGPVLPVVENWNRVLSYATGDYFVLFSDDDRYHPDFLSEMKMLLDKYPKCNITHCRITKIDKDGEFLSMSATCPEYESGIDFIFSRLNSVREQFAPDFMVKTDKLKSIGGFADLPLAWGSDDLTWFKLALEGGIAYSSKPLFEWRQSATQISVSGDMADRLSAVEIYEAKLMAFIDAIHPKDAAGLKLPDTLRSLVPGQSARNKEHLIAVNAVHDPFFRHTFRFFKLRKRFHLKFSWLVYSWYVKLRQAGSLTT